MDCNCYPHMTIGKVWICRFNGYCLFVSRVDGKTRYTMSLDFFKVENQKQSVF